MDSRLDFSLSELIEVAPTTSHYRMKIQDALRAYFLSEGKAVVDRKANRTVSDAPIIKGKIDWKAIYRDLSDVDDFRNLKINNDEWNTNLVQNYSKIPPGGDDKYHICLLYWLHLPEHQIYNSEKLNRIAHDLCKDIFHGLTASQKVAQRRDVKQANKDLPVGQWEPVGGARTREFTQDAGEQEPPVSTGFPDLYLESVTPGASNWLSPFNEQSLPFAGRRTLKERLDEFADKPDALSVWALVGPSGAGKTRLAANWLRTSQILSGWNKGFLTRPTVEEWTRWRPERPTFIVVDDLFAHGDAIAAIVDRCVTLMRIGILRYPVRLLIIDRVFPADIDDLLADDRWNAVFRKTMDIDVKTSILHSSAPLSLVNADDDADILRSIMHAASGLADAADDRLTSALKQLHEMNSADRPLFAALLGRRLSTNHAAEHRTRKDLIRYHLSGNDHLPWLNDDVDGDLVGCFVAAATILRGASFERLVSALPSDVTANSSRVIRIRAQAARIVGGHERSVLPAFLPDLLGEAFFMLLLERLENSPPRMAILKRMCTLATNDQHERGDGFVSFFQGLITNLTTEGAIKFEVDKSCSSILKFLEFDDRDDTKNSVAKSVSMMSIVNQLNRNNTDQSEIRYIVQIKSFKEIKSLSSGYFCTILEFVNWKLSTKSTSGDHEADELVNFTRNFSPAEGKDVSHVLALSAENGHYFLVKGLLERGADPNVQCREGRTALHFASGNGHTDVVRSLLAHGAEPDRGQDIDGSTALMFACEGGHLQTVKALLKGNANPNKDRFSDGATAVLLAAAFDHIDVLQYLAGEGAKLDHHAADGRTALAMACIRGNAVVVRALLELGVDPNRCSRTGDPTPLFLACRHGHLAIAKMLIEEADAFVETQSLRDQPLFGAATDGHLLIIKYLQSIGVRLNTANGVDALAIASHGGHLECVKYLTQYADPNAIGTMSCTALTAACSNGQNEVAEFLIANGAVPQLPDGEGRTPLTCVAENGSRALIELLLRKGCDPNTVDSGGRNALGCACFNDNADAAEALLDAGAALTSAVQDEMPDPCCLAADIGSTRIVRLFLARGKSPDDVCPSTGKTALTTASQEGHLAVVRELLGAHASPDITSEVQESSALMWATQGGHHEIVAHLLEAGADPNIQRKSDGMSALHVAASHGRTAIGKLLIANRANPNIQNRDCVTPLMSATKARYSDMIELLISEGARTDIEDKFGKRAIYYTIANFDSDAFKTLANYESTSYLIRTIFIMFLRRIQMGYYSIIKNEEMIKAIGEWSYLLFVSRKSKKRQDCFR